MIESIRQEGLRKDIPAFNTGDTVRVYVKVVEGASERVQRFDGVVIAKSGTGISSTFTVRKTSFGIGVERIFPLHSPRIEKLEVLKTGKARRAKLFYLRKLTGKSARLEERVRGEASVPSEQPVAEPVSAPVKESPEAAQKP